jgi:hypothetical protein
VEAVLEVDTVQEDIDEKEKVKESVLAVAKVMCA